MPNRSLVLIPGLLCDDAVWAGVIAALPAGTQTWVPDHGLHHSLPAMAQAALQGSAPGPLWIAGHSMGGRVALEMYRQAPERVAGLALLDTGWLPLAAGERGETERAQRHDLLEIAQRDGMREAGQRWASGMVHPQQLDTPLFESILKMVERKTPQIFAAQIRALLARPDATDLLATIACPTLVMCGRQDRWSPVAQHEALASMIPNATLRIIETAGHMLPMEQAQATADALAHWLRGVPGHS